MSDEQSDYRHEELVLEKILDKFNLVYHVKTEITPYKDDSNKNEQRATIILRRGTTRE